MALFSKQSAAAPRRRTQGADSAPHRATEAELEQRYAFRRNQTITGSASSKVTTLSEKSAHLRSPRVQAHALVALRRRLLMAFVITLVSSAALFALVTQLTGRVSARVDAASVATDAGVYRAAIEDYLQKAPIERLRPLLNSAALTAHVQRTAPEIKSIRVTGGQQLGESMFQLTPRQPVVGWTINGEQRYVDETGTAFGRNYYEPPSVQVVDRSGIPVRPGVAVASNRFLGFIGRLIGIASANGYKPIEVIIPPATSRQVELRLADLKPGVIVSVDRPAGEQVEDMKQALNWFQSKNQTPQYIDVRVSGKAYYR